MRERTDRDHIRPSLRQCTDTLLSHPTRDLNNQGHRMLADQAHTLANQRRPHIVEQHSMYDRQVTSRDPGSVKVQEFAQLVNGVNLDLDPDQMANPCRQPLQYRLEATSKTQVVVFDQDGIVQSESMIDSPTVDHRLLLQHPQPRSRLSGVGDPHTSACDEFDHVRGTGGYPTELTKEVEGGPFASEDRARPPTHPQDLLTGLHSLTVCG